MGTFSQPDDMRRKPMIGEIYMMEFEGNEHVQAGKRPGIVFQNNLGNEYSPNIIAIPLTSCLKKQQLPAHVVIRAEDAQLRKDSMALCENPVCVSKTRIGFYISSLNENDMKRVAKASILATSIIAFLDEDELIETWHTSRKLNKM